VKTALIDAGFADRMARRRVQGGDTMKRNRRQFRPTAGELLECRLALTYGGPLAPALIGTLSRNPRASGRTGRVVAQINDAFDRFTRDYMQAQGAYLSSGAATSAFTTFTTQRVNLLAQELTRIFARLPGSFARIQNANQRSMTNSSIVFQAFLRRNINGAPASSLGKILTSSDVVPPQGTTGAGATLYTLTATNAIGAAQTATINAAKFVASGTFANS
jgi:hypothetical protein